MKSDRRDPEPDPGQADRRGAVRGAQAEPGRGLQEDRRAGHHPRLPQGQGAAAGHRPALRPRRGAGGGRQRRAAQVLRRGRRGATTSRCSGQPEVDVTELEDGAAPDVHRRGRRPARSSTCRTTRASRSPSTTPRSPTPTSTSSSTGCASGSRTLTGVDRAAADGDFVSIDLSATVDGEAVDGPHRQGPELPGRRRRRCSRASTRPSPGWRPASPRDFATDAGRRRPRRRGGRRHRRR